MPLPTPAAAMPDMTAFMAQARERAGSQMQAAWAQLSQPSSQAMSVPAGPPPAGTPGPGGYAQALGNWGQGPSGPSASASGGEGREAYNRRLRELGVPEHVIEGNAWNVQDESAWNFGAVGDQGAAFGANQWNGPRKEALFAFARDRGMDPSNPILQADFWHHEMNTQYRRVYDKAVSSGSPTGAALAILNEYEIPALQHRQRRAADYSGRANSYAPVVASFGR